MRIKKRLRLSRILFFIFIFSIVDQPWLEKTRATIAEEVAVAGFMTAGIMRAVACAGVALYRACTQGNNSVHNHTAVQKACATRNYTAPILSTSAQITPANNHTPALASAYPSSTIAFPVASSITNKVALTNNSAFIAQAYANSLSEKGKTIADQAARTIADGWNDRVRANITQAMCQANFRTNGVALDISCWTQPSHTVEMVPGGAIHRYNYGFYSKSSAAAHRRGRSSLAEWLDARQRERLIIMNDSERSYAVKQTIDSFVKNGHKLVFGTLVERVIAALNLPSFYIDGISYGYDLAVAQERL